MHRRQSWSTWARTLASLALLTGVSALGVTRAGAQGGTFLPGAYSWDGTPGTEYAVCGNDTPSGASSFDCVLSGTQGSATFSSSASAEGGQLRVYTSSRTEAFVDERSRAIWNGAGAQWYDGFNIPAGTTAPTTARYFLDADGFVTSSGAGYTGLDLFMKYLGQGSAGWLSASPSVRINPQECCQFTDQRVYQQSRYVFDVPLAAGFNAFSFEIWATAHVSTSASVVTDGFSEMDYLNTAQIAGVQFFDGAVDVTASLEGLTSQQGIAYALGDPSATVTPEPVSMVLLGTGLVGIAGVAGRRRRRIDDETAV